MHELTNLDLVIIVLYMIGMLFVGVWFVKRIKNTGDYYVAGRTLGPFVLTATVCASIIGGSAMMGRAGIAYTTGFKAVMTAIPYLIGMFIFSAIAGRIQEVGFTRNINSHTGTFQLQVQQHCPLYPGFHDRLHHDGHCGCPGDCHRHHHQDAGK